MTTIISIDEYLNQFNKLAPKVLDDEHSLKELLDLIDRQKDLCGESESDKNFYQAEHAFVSGQPELALKFYLQSRSIPQFQFYCYRASAYVSQKQNQIEKAVKFAQKALTVRPDDFYSQAIIDRSANLSLPKETPEVPPKILLEENKIAELGNIFQERTENKDGLFACEFPLQSQQKLSENIPESPMNIDFFSSSKNRDTETADILTQRLYSSSPTEETEPSREKSNTALLDELRKIAVIEPAKQSDPAPRAPRFAPVALDISYDSEQALESQIKSFQTMQTEALTSYLEHAKKRSTIPDHCLYVLNGWGNQPIESRSFLTEHARKSTGGFYLRWAGKGIVINPGTHFLHYFHQQGLNIKDIDYVIVTRSTPDSYTDVKEIYSLNTQLNKIHPEFQVIHYYLNQKAYQDLAPYLKPNFKQERNTVHPLEIFLDSPDVEKIELTPDINLHYFPVTKQEGFQVSLLPNQKPISSLGIKLELKPSFTTESLNHENSTIHFGYISGASWTPLLSHYLGLCDVLIAGFGNTHPNDYQKLKYNEDSLGYFGTYSLFEEVNPRLLLTCEFGGREGDIRLEALHMMKQEHARLPSRQQTAILPGDIGLFVDLKSLKIRCSLTQKLVDPSQLRVVKSAESFGNLHYLSPSCFF